MKKIRNLMIVVLTIAVIVVLSACGQQAPKEAAKNAPTPTAGKLSGTIKIGRALAETGPYASGGKPMSLAIEMAIEEVNKSGLLGDAKFEFVHEDAMNTNEATINAVQKLINTDKAQFIIGGPTSSQSIAAIPIAQKAGVISLVPNSAGQVAEIGDHTFLIMPLLQDMVPEALDKIVKAKNIKTVALLTAKDYAVSVACTANRRTEFNKLGVKILVDEEDTNNVTDFTSVVSKIIAANPDMVIADGAPPHDPLFFKQLKNAGYKGVLMGGASDNVPSIFEKDPATYEGILNIGVWFANLPNASEKSKTFEKEYKAKYNMDPDQYAATCNDNVWLLANAIKNAGTADADAVLKQFKTIEYEGVQGKLKFNDKRVQTHVPLLFEIKNGKPVILNY